MNVFVKAFDTSPPLEATLLDGAKSPLDLTGATVVFSLGTGGTLISESAVTVISALEGRVRYSWAAGELFPGTYNAEFEVTKSDGSIETFPRKGYITVHVSDREGAPGALLDLAITSANARHVLVTAALGQSTADRFLDLNGDGSVTTADTDLALGAVNDMTDVKNGVAAEVTAYRAVPGLIKAMLAGTSASVPVVSTGGKTFFTDIDGSGTITNTDLLYAEALARYGP